MAGGRKYVAPEAFREFAKAGARIRLLAIEKEKMLIHAEFPDIGANGLAVPLKVAAKAQKKAKKAKKRKAKSKVAAKGTQPLVMDFFTKQPSTVAKPHEVATLLKLSQKQANNAMWVLQRKKLLKVDGHGRYQLRDAK